jgi:cyanobactin maturation PatA/PatG family protease
VQIASTNAAAPAVLPAWQVEIGRVSAGFPGDPRIRVAVVDGPVDFQHPCLAGASIEQLEAADVDPLDGAAARHGTSVSSLLFGQPRSVIEGIVPRCHGLIAPVLTARDNVVGGSQVDLARGIALALENGANIINISAGQADVGGEPHPYLEEMVRRCSSQGILVVAAAGNDGCSCVHVPAASSSVLTVGAMDDRGHPLASSNWGAAYRDHGVLAPGAGIRAAASNGGVAFYNGTSWATSIVSGFAALLLSALVDRGEQPDCARVRAAILETADGIEGCSGADCVRLLAGRFNPAGAWMRLLERRRNHTMDSQQVVQTASGPPEPPPYVEISGSGCSCGGSSGETKSASGCGCGGQSGECHCNEKQQAPSDGGSCAKKGPPQRVYVLGQLGYDFGSETRRESFLQRGVANPYNPAELLQYLRDNRAAAASIQWTLIQDATTIYIIQPIGPFAADTYDLLQQFLRQQIENGVERISVAGWIAGKGKLTNGESVPVIVPEHRSLYSWTTEGLLEAVVGKAASRKAAGEQSNELANFLDRIYYEVRNLGILPQERAMNYAATNAFQLGDVYSRAAKAGLKLDAIGVERSPICRSDADCWDVKLTFFNPAKRLDQAREVFRFTVDVSDVLPVTVGPVRSWHIY